ncbi:CoA:oxalate CoA-transferase [Sporomusaceae bacterium BoRhaA]|uniref:CaiB/BaiF CoA transferase family protein n=1 Tax=Pelorhabdus rhamnosifermentans TaxID=2772457 RepID=UPI001C061111|nr:CaiB/BaiF CoA-transferase family protein [Pelorhabdus rhamnosifermentans]MBU2702408.1 CoA:oxalate CoA-transferase [Pelorhabdus rhamnosifermentans]
MKPLEGICVLDLSRVLAGPYTSMMLADFGADVIKIETPEVGDDSRAFGPFVNKESAYFMSLNRGKRSMTLNLKLSEGQEIFKEMVKKADVVLENYRPGVMEKFGLGYEVLQEINPRIIYAACSGFGHSGPYMKKPAYDVIVQGLGGIMSITGQEGGEPTRVGASVGDITAGLFTATGILTALYSRAITGKGQKVDVAMLDCQVAILENAISRYLVSGTVPSPIGNRHPSITPFEAFRAQDGYIIIAIGNDRLWAKFCQLIKREDLVTDEHFVANADRTKNQKQLKSILDGEFPAKTVAEWIEVLDGAGIPCGPINTVDQVIADPQVQARNMIVEIDHPVAGRLKMPGLPIKLSATPGAVETPAPLLGQHTEEILQEFLGMSTQQLADLRAKKVI